MNKSIDDILATIRNLIARAKDSASTPAEAASAMAHVQRLMEKYRIDEAQLAQGIDEECVKVGHSRVADTGNDTLPQWVWAIFATLALQNRCTPYLEHGVMVNEKMKTVKRVFLCAIGTEMDRAVVGYMFEYIRSQIMRLALEGARVAGESKSPKWLNAFRVGASRTVVDRLFDQSDAIRAEARRLAAGEGKDLALVDAKEKAVKDAVTEYENTTLRLGRRASRVTKVSGSAVEQGRAAGHSVDISTRHGSKQLG